MANYIVSATGKTQVTIDEVTYTGTPVASLAAANAVAGDTIYIANGEILNAQGKTTLKSVAVIGGTDTVISGNVASANGAAMQISGVSQLAGMTFYNNRNGKTNGDGGALLASGTVTIKNVIFDYNRTKDIGGAAKITGTNSLVSISGTSFINNETDTANGGALCVDSSAAITVSGCFFDNNKNGALRVESSAAIGATVSGSTFASAQDTIYVAENSTLRFAGSNTLNAGIINDGTIGFADGAEVVFSGSETADLGGLDLSEVNISVAADVLTGNDAFTIYSNVKLAGNQQISVGNGQYTLNDDFYIGNNKYCFTHTGSTLAFTKTAVTLGVVSSVENPMFKGNAVSAPRHSTLTEALNAKYTDIILADNEILDAQGKATLNDITVIGGKNTIISNNATNASGGALLTSGTVQLSGMTFYKNRSSKSNGTGGAIINNGTLTVDNVTFDSNHAKGDGFAMQVTGSAGNASISNSRFTGNYSDSTTENVGALSINSAATATVSNTYFADNTNGALAVTSSATVGATVSGCTFATARDTIYNAGIVKFSGENTINASLTGSGTFNVAENAVLTFDNTEEIDIAALTINTANSNSINLNGTVVNFTGLDASKVTITVDGTGLGAGTVIATGVTAIGAYTINNKSNVYLELAVVDNDLVLKEIDAQITVGSDLASYAGSGVTIMDGGKVGTLFATKGNESEIATKISGGKVESNLVAGAYVAAGKTAAVDKVELLIGGTAEVAAKVYAGGYLYGNGADSAEAQLTVGEVNITLDGGAVSTNMYGGVHAREYGNAKVETVNITVTDGSHGRIYAGGWAEKGAVSSVGTANVTISGGTVDYLYGGGANADGTTTVDTTTITIENSALVNTVFMSGRYGYSSVSGTVTLNYNSTTGMKRLSGVSSAGVDNAKNTVVNVLSDLTADLIDYVDKFVISEGCTLTANDAFYLGNRTATGETDGFTTFDFIAEGKAEWTAVAGIDDFTNAKFSVNGEGLTTWDGSAAIAIGGYSLTYDAADKTIKLAQITA